MNNKARQNHWFKYVFVLSFYICNHSLSPDHIVLHDICHISYVVFICSIIMDMFQQHSKLSIERLKYSLQRGAVFKHHIWGRPRLKPWLFPHHSNSQVRELLRINSCVCRQVCCQGLGMQQVGLRIGGRYITLLGPSNRGLGPSKGSEWGEV